MDSLILAIIALVIPFLVSKLLQVLWVLFWRPYSLTKRFKKQGISGPPYRVLSGSLDEIKSMQKDAREMILDTDSNDIVQKVIPHYQKWSSEYGQLLSIFVFLHLCQRSELIFNFDVTGEMFLYWHGTDLQLVVQDPELAKQILSSKFGFYRKPRSKPPIPTLTGKGLALLEGVD
ncbi:hypothetical protein SLE2022_330690 [Rubroshorea leprosula]